MRKIQFPNLICSIVIIAALLAVSGSGCSGESGPAQSPAAESSAAGSETQAAEDIPDTHFETSYRETVFSEEYAEGNEEVWLDISHSQDGYFGVYSDSDARLKLQVIKDDVTYTYDLTPQTLDYFPFQSGNGSYNIRVMKNLEGKKYFELYSAVADVTLASVYEPYLRCGQYARYTRGSECVALACELAGSASSAEDFIYKVYDRVCSSITYDYDKAELELTGYIPDPDDTLRTGKGICFDYASLAASMLRSQGIPVKIIFGYVAPDDLYHAWNMFYVEGAGWTSVKFVQDANDWSRMDLTFSANGANADFIGDGSNYTDIYQY